MTERQIVRKEKCPIAFKTQSIQYIETGKKDEPQQYTPNKKGCKKHEHKHKHHHHHHHHHHKHHHEHEVPVPPVPPVPPVILKWRCSGEPDFVCIESVDGIYDTLQECQRGCGTPPTFLGTAANFRILAAETITNTGLTTIDGNLGLTPGTSVTGSPTVTGTSYIGPANAVAIQAQIDMINAYNTIAATPFTTDLTGQDLGTLLPLLAGVYHFDTSAQLTGNLVLDAGGNPNAVWMFQIGSTLTTANISTVTIINGGSANNVYWQVGSSATLGGGTSFVGNILALASITLNTGATISGRALAHTAAITLAANTIGP
jgi:hypothetical protein